MSNPSAILRLTGTVYDGPNERVIEPAEALPAKYDDTGRMTHAARDARPGYTVYDYTILTKGGGFASVVFRDAAIAESGGYFPGKGDEIADVPVRAYDVWAGPQARRYRVTAYSFAGAVYAEEAKSRTGGARSAVSAVS